MSKFKQLSSGVYVAGQLQVDDVVRAHAEGIKTIVCNRPDEEGGPPSATLAATAGELGLEFVYLPMASPADAASLAEDCAVQLQREGDILLYCRSGRRSTVLWEAARAGAALAGGAENTQRVGSSSGKATNVVIIGGGAGGISMAASLLKRDASLNVTIIEPSDKHYYQAGFTLVGGGCYSPDTAIREEAGLIPRGVTWLKAAVTELQPERNSLLLDNGGSVAYDYLVVCPGLQLNWAGIEGLEDTIGRNGVSCNYLLPYARYTWQCLQNMKSGRALFTQPPMPIKCAGAPQKIMYLAAHHWEKSGQLKDVDIEFHTATPALFGVAAFVPALEKYIDRYNVDLNLQSTLLAVDGSAKTARFKQGDSEVVKEFDFIHVVPPQVSPEFVRVSALADEAGWLAVQPDTLRHVKYENVFGVGDVMNAPNAKTAAAVRKQVPVVADNLLALASGKPMNASYNGYGACPLTVEKGRVVLAEFGYGGKLLPSFPIDGTKPSRFGWVFKRHMLPGIYWDLMLKGREVMAKPDPLTPVE